MKSKTTALILSIFLGELGIDRFYLGYVGMGILKLLTVGGFGIIWLIDIIRIATGSLAPANGAGYGSDFSVTTIQPQAGSNAYDDLKKIAELHDQGALSDDEYAKLKADLMERM